MKKIVFFLLCILCIGCEKKVETVTIINNSQSSKIAINYPVTNIKKVDSKIKKYIETKKQDFLELENALELNISYEYYNSLNLTSILIKTEIEGGIELYAINFDKKKNKFLNLKDVIDLSKFQPKIMNILKTNYGKCFKENNVYNLNLDNHTLFFIDEKNVHIYFQNKLDLDTCNNINVTLNLDKVDKESHFEPIIPNLIDIDLNKPVVALTFDDGPSKYTKKIVELLKKYEAHATFFIIGNKVEIYEDTIRLMYQNGNEIGNHSFDHKWLTRLDEDNLKEQIEKTQKIIKKVTGFTPTLIRPTYGSINNNLRSKLNLDVVMWSIDTRDWQTKNVKKIVANALKDVKSGDIILMHDAYERTYKSLKQIIPSLQNQGFSLVTVSELKQIEALKKTVK